MCPADGGPEVKLSSRAGFEVGQPDWSPDGFQLIFVAINPRTGRFRPIMIDIDPEAGRTVKQHDFDVPGVDGDVLSAAYSMLSPGVALMERIADGSLRIWIVDIETRVKRLLTEGHHAQTEGFGVDFDPWSDSLVFAALDGEHHPLFSIATGGSATPPRRLTNLTDEGYVPQFSTDGERMAFTVYAHTKTVKRAAWPAGPER
ncbi:MAG: Tol biopolymer transport system component [Chlamydiales bacterium]|jgi:Tol biopolymer transport system component